MTENINQEHIGSNFDDFLAEENTLEKCTSVAKKRVQEWKNELETKDTLVNKSKDLS